MLGVAQLINDAWTHESNNDHEVAARLYKTAYYTINELNSSASANPLSSGVSQFEIRSIADYLNYRSCHIHFTLNHPREAISQFKKFIDTFKQHTKAPEYAFEHAAWLSQQYLMFADLFHQAVTNGVKASKTQHPGHYYYEGAMQIIDRRNNVTIYTNDTIRSNQMPVTAELLSLITTSSFSSFLRQCGWTCVDANDGPPVDSTRMKAEPQEKHEPPNYSETIVRALYKAIEYFQVDEWSRPRMQNYISVLIANEYKSMSEHKKAYTLYSKSLNMYNVEGWTILSHYISEKLTQIENEHTTHRTSVD